MLHFRASQKQRKQNEILAHLAQCGTLAYLIETPDLNVYGLPVTHY